MKKPYCVDAHPDPKEFTLPEGKVMVCATCGEQMLGPAISEEKIVELLAAK